MYLAVPVTLCTIYLQKLLLLFLKRQALTEDLAVDVSYWFDKSTKRKAGFGEFCVLCDTTYKEVVSHVSTRWLALKKLSLAF